MGVTISESWDFMGALGKRVHWDTVQRNLKLLLEGDMDRVARQFERFLENGGSCTSPYPPDVNNLDP